MVNEDEVAGIIEIAQNQPTLGDLIRLTDNLIALGDKTLTAQVAIALRRMNKPIMMYRKEHGTW